MFYGPTVLPAELAPAEALNRLSPLGDDDFVVVRREEQGRTYHYVFRVGVLRDALGFGDGAGLTDALNLHEWGATPEADLRDLPGVAGERGTVVVIDGDQVAGVLAPDPGGAHDRGGGTRGRGTTYRGGGGGGGGYWAGNGGERNRGIEDDANDAGGQDHSSEESPTGPIDLFRAFPRVQADDSVESGVEFDVEVGLATDGAVGATPLLLVPSEDDPAGAVRFTVQVMGFGFDFPKGVRGELVADRKDVGRATTKFCVVAQPVTTHVVRVLEVSYEHGGNVVGRAWREINVGATAAPVATDQPRSGGTAIGPSPDVAAPHLSVEIRTRQGDSEVEWLLHSRFTDVRLPSHRVTTTLTEGSAKEFAVQLMAQVPGASGSRLLGPTIVGIGRKVAAAMPSEFWELFVDVWDKAKTADEVPSMLILTNEPYVPWELAWVGDDYLPATELPTDASGTPGMPLGSACRVGRWVPPVTRTPRGGDRPATPPPAHLDVSAMAVVIGDYASDTSVRPLPQAEEEGTAIALKYKGYPLKATEDDVLRLLQNRLERHGVAFAPTAVHIAAHGEVDTAMQQYSGIILSASDRRLDPIVVQGSELTRRNRPFVFLNACQVGTAGAFLSDYGGMPGAFLSEGCTGYVAPLWNVDDTVAKDFATEFYAAVLDNGTPVAEALRALRSRFGTEWSGNTATPLAYVFYGHPELSLSRT